MTTSLLNFHEAQALVIDTWHDRRVLRYTLHDLNLHKVVEIDSAFSQRKDNFDLRQIDLILANVSEMDASAIKFISDIRWRRIPCNPFTVIVMTSNTHEPSVIRPSIDSGADAIILKPFSPQKLREHVLAVTERRRPFIVTADYIGPERRQSLRPESKLRHFDVPNTLRSKVLRQGDGSYQAIDVAWNSIESELIHRIVYKILFFIRLLQVPPTATTVSTIRQELSGFPNTAKMLLTHLTEPSLKVVGVTLIDWLAKYPKLIGVASRNQSRDDAQSLIMGLLSLLGRDEEPEKIIDEVDGNVSRFLHRIEPARTPEAMAS